MPSSPIHSHVGQVFVPVRDLERSARWYGDLGKTAEHLRRLEVRPTSEGVDVGSVAFVQFEDPDGNPLMVCERRR